MYFKKVITGLSFATMLAVVTAHASQLGLMVASYFVPGEKWDAMNYAASRVPLIAIMNPNSGPGTSQRTGYVNALARLHEAGGKTIGYVSSSYTKRPLAEVKTDIDRYLAWYAVDGFFIDEMTNDSDTNHLNYYAAIFGYIKGKGAQYSVTGNPGANTQESYLTQPTADTLMIFESGSDKYAGYDPSNWVAKHPPEHFAHLPYGVAGEERMSNYVSAAASRNAGWIYISDLTTYSKLPTYWTNEVNLVQSLNAARLSPGKSGSK